MSAESTKEATAEGHKVTTVVEGTDATAAPPAEPKVAIVTGASRGLGRGVGGDQGGDLLEEGQQPVGEGQLVRRRDHTVRHMADARALHGDHPPAGAAEARVQSEDSQGGHGVSIGLFGDCSYRPIGRGQG